MKRVPIEIEGCQAFIESIAWHRTYSKDDTLDIRLSISGSVGVYDICGFEISLPAKQYNTPEEFLNAVRVAAGARLRAIIDEGQDDLARRQEDKPIVLTRLVAEIKALIGLD